MTARDYEAEAVEALNGTQRHTGLGLYEGDPPSSERAQALATLEVAKQVRRVADAMERKPEPLDVALIERALDVASPWDIDLVRSALAELRRWKEQQP